MRKQLQQIYDELQAVQRAHANLATTLGHGPASFYFEKIQTYIDGLFSFAKFKEGDRACLKKDIDPIPSGWSGCAHFLKRCEPVTVREVDYGKSGFRYAVEFDNESWIDRNKEIRPITDKHTFWLHENDLIPF